MSLATKQRLVIVTIVALALVEPLTHLWIQVFPGEGYAPSGIHTGDSGHHLVAMRAFATGFHSPYATCANDGGPHGAHYFATPFFLMYAVFGAVGDALGVGMFLWLGILNGLGGALMLTAAYALLRVVVPRHAESAFFLYALSGGLGGALYLFARASGWYSAPGFEDQFYRFAVYDLIEGQHRAPLLLFPRLYYTLPLAAAYAALALVIRRDGTPQRFALGAAMALLALAAFLNLRIAPMALLVIGLYFVFPSRRAIATRLRILAAMAIAMVAGIGAALIVSRDNQSYYANVDSIGDQVTWLLPLLYATIFLWPGIGAAVLTSLREAPSMPRVIVAALAGYLLAFTALVIGYHVYYGNYLHGGDTNAAVAVSGFAMAVVVPSVFVGYFWWRNRPRVENAFPIWLTMWALGFLAMTVSAGANGAWLSITPQRFLVFAALPMAALAALGFDMMRPTFCRAGYGAALGFGGVSLLVGALCFQGPLGHTPGKAPFGWLHYERINDADAELIAQIPGGTVAVPPWSPFAFSELLAQKPEIQVFSGPGAMNLGGTDFHTIMADLSRFWNPNTPDTERQSITLSYCLDYVYYPATCSPSDAIQAALDATPWLDKAAASGSARLYRVTIPTPE